MNDLSVLLDINGMDLRDAPWAYRDLGWKVFGLQAGGKAPHSSRPGGFHNATTAPVRLRWWWPAAGGWDDDLSDMENVRRADTCNIGIPTGEYFDVLDIDVKGSVSGYVAAKRLRDAGLLDDPMAAAVTPSGGMHILFRPSGAPSGALPKHGLDFKALGGYIVVSPSGIDGEPDWESERGGYVRRPYEWTDVDGGSGVLDWSAAVDLLAPATKRRASYDGPVSAAGLVAFVSRLSEGERNRGLYWAARRLAEAGQDPSVLGAVALDAGLEAWEVDRTIASAARTEGLR